MRALAIRRRVARGRAARRREACEAAGTLPAMAETPTHAEPAFVRTDEDRERWDAAVKAASAALGMPEGSEAVWSAARVLYHDKSIPTK